MANAGFNSATDLFNMGSSWKVKSSSLNKSANNAECPNSQGDITHRDVYGERIAPSAEYELGATDVTSLPALGTVVTIESLKVAIASIAIKTSKGAPVTATVTGVQVQANATDKRTYSCGTVNIAARHKAQDILGLYGATAPATLTGSSFTFTADINVAEPKGVVENHDVANGKVVATYSHTSGDGAAITAPTISASDVSSILHQPVTKTSPENDYVTTECGVTKSLTGTDATNG